MALAALAHRQTSMTSMLAGQVSPRSRISTTTESSISWPALRCYWGMGRAASELRSPMGWEAWVLTLAQTLSLLISTVTVTSTSHQPQLVRPEYCSATARVGFGLHPVRPAGALTGWPRQTLIGMA